MKRIFLIDWAMVATFLLSASTGIALHVAAHGSSHEAWHNHSVAHVVASMAFLIAAVLHVATHYQWYKGIARRGMGRKSKVTMTLTLLFLLSAITGTALLFVSGPSTAIGHLHLIIATIMTIIAVGHTIKRFPVLRKSLKRNERFR